MISEWSAELTLTEESSKALFDVLHQQDLEFINGLLDGKHGFTLQSSDGRSVELVPAPKWIPCSERLPEDIRPVLVTWKNTDPASYYQYIVGKHFIGTAHYCKGKWYWYSSVTEDLLAEYGKCESEEFDEAIETVAWMPLPEPWKGADDE